MTIQIENSQKRHKIDRRRLRAMVNRLMKLTDNEHREISITLVDDPTIQQMNRQYLGKDRPTNVISFSLQEGEFGFVNPDVLGDIVISVDTAFKDAIREGLTLEEELDYLIIHGLLHLTGYNHENTTPEEARRMRRREKDLFDKINGLDSKQTARKQNPKS